MFAIHREILYRILVESPSGAWVIEVARNGQPKWIDKSLLGYFKRVPTPDSFLKASEKKLSPAAAKRLALIQPMLEDPIYIIDRKACLKKATEIASAYATTPKRVRRLFYLYLATGETTSSKHSNKSIQPDFEWAIKTLYFSAKQMSLKQTYETSVTIRFHIGSAVAEVYTDNGYYDEVVMDTTAVVRNGRTFAPIRYLAEAAGYEVDWEGNSQTVSLYSEERRFFEALSYAISQRQHHESNR